MHTAATLVSSDVLGGMPNGGSPRRTSPGASRKTSSPSALVSAGATDPASTSPRTGGGHFPALSKRAISIQSHSPSRQTVPQPGQRSIGQFCMRKAVGPVQCFAQRLLDIPRAANPQLCRKFERVKRPRPMVQLVKSIKIFIFIAVDAQRLTPVLLQHLRQRSPRRTRRTRE